MKADKHRTSLSQNAQAFRVCKLPSKAPLSPPFNEELRRHPLQSLIIQKKSKDRTSTGSGSETQEQQEEDNIHTDSTSKSQQSAAVEAVIKILIAKGQKFKEVIAAKGQPMAAWIVQSQPIRIKTQSILDKLIDQRRLNLDLKGLNNLIIAQIQRGLLSTLANEANIYQKQQEFEETKSSLIDSLQSYKSELLKQIEALSNKQ